jgi:hypothetical protein
MRKVIVKAKDLISAIEEAKLRFEDLYLIVNGSNFSFVNNSGIEPYGSNYKEDFFHIWCFSEDRGVAGFSDIRPVAYDGLGRLDIKINYEEVDLILTIAKELIKIYDEDRALIVFYEIKDGFAISFLNSTIEQERKKINKALFRELKKED